MTERSTKWHNRYMELAALVATWSKDPGTKVGAVCVGEFGQILSTGYNGFPRGVDDSEDRLNDRPTKLLYTIHAEPNCVYNASLTGVSLRGSTMYVHGLPTCSECAKSIIQAGISTLVVKYENITAKPEWEESWKTSLLMLNEAGVNVDILYKPVPAVPYIRFDDFDGVSPMRAPKASVAALRRKYSPITLEEEIGESDYMYDTNDKQGC